MFVQTLKQPERARGAAEPRCSRSSRSPEAGKCGWENPDKNGGKLKPSAS